MYYILILLFLILLRIKAVCSKAKPTARNQNSTCSLAIFLGSGGHTTEALALVSGLNFNRYRPRTYIVSEGDSVQKAVSLEETKSTPDSSFRILTIPRARKVHQSLISSVATSFISLLSCVYHVTIVPLFKENFADALIINGPGTCVILCLAVYLNKFLGLSHPKIIYVESFARVKAVSLSGKLLSPLVDRFIVQWPNLLHEEKREYHGILV